MGKDAAPKRSTGSDPEVRLIQKSEHQKLGKARALKLAGVEPVGRGKGMGLIVGSETVHLCVNEMQITATILHRRSPGKITHAYNPSNREAEKEDSLRDQGLHSQIKASLDLGWEYSSARRGLAEHG